MTDEQQHRLGVGAISLVALGIGYTLYTAIASQVPTSQCQAAWMAEHKGLMAKVDECAARTDNVYRCVDALMLARGATCSGGGR